MIIFLLIIYIFLKMDEVRKLKLNLRTLQRKLDETDEQARLIIRTDLELHQVQEELDRRISSLWALQRFSQVTSGSLREEEVFGSIGERLINDLGFNFCLIFLKREGKILPVVSLGSYDIDRSEVFLNLVEKIGLESLKHERIFFNRPHPKFEDFKKKIFELFGLSSFVLMPLVVMGEVRGGVILGKLQEKVFSESDEQLAEIFSAQISQSLGNIHLFEELYNSRQELENKIRARTRELEKILEELRRVNKLKSEFVSSVSHELRTPLTSIKGYASLLMDEKFGNIPPEVKMRLERINQQADTLVTMVNELLDIARIESGRMKLEIQKFDLVELLKRVYDFLLPQISQKRLKFELIYPEEALMEADKKLIERLFINLLSNAIKFTPSEKKIRVEIEEGEDSFEVSVKDEGVGIPPEDLENIFKEFYRSSNPLSKESQGTGLGLSLVKNIVEAHRGKIRVESKLGEGSNFIFVLPKHFEEKSSDEKR